RPPPATAAPRSVPHVRASPRPWRGRPGLQPQTARWLSRQVGTKASRGWSARPDRAVGLRAWAASLVRTYQPQSIVYRPPPRTKRSLLAEGLQGGFGRQEALGGGAAVEELGELQVLAQSAVAAFVHHPEVELAARVLLRRRP